MKMLYLSEQCPKEGGGTSKYPTNEPPPPPNISPCNLNVHVFYQKSTEREIIFGRGQKQVIDVHVHLLKAPSSNRSPPKRPF